ncbi:MAG TPA: M1 family aminopeptidase [Gemmata sp.]|nr:M1 family aminopeptidase [Gemmata sp.]
MSIVRLIQVFRVDLLFNLRRPLFWILILILGLTSWGLSSGTLQIASGDSRVGGTKAWITSEFAVAQVMTMVLFAFYSFFVAVAAGMPVIRDDELKLSELLHSTPLRVGEYVWGKFAAVLVCFVAVLGLHLLCMMFFNHLVPNERSLEISGPFDPWHYLRPALVIAVPTLVFLTGISFAIGTWLRRPILLFVLPLAALLVCGFFLWEWSPSWLDPRINRLLMLLDPSGFRWLNETWLKSDRGVQFYNTASVPFDPPFLMSRLAFLLIGLGSVAFCHLRLAATLRGSPGHRNGWITRLWQRTPKREQIESALEQGTATLADLKMQSVPPSFLRSLWLVARVELRELRSQPGLYLFIPIILLQTIGTNVLAVGAFDTPLLATSGTLAVASMNTLTFFVCLLLMFYNVESLQRDRTTGFASILYATSVQTPALLFGKALANSIVGALVLLANLAGCLIVLQIQGQVAIELAPFVLVWGLLLLPTFLLWTSFITASYAMTGNRYTTYGIGLAVVAFSLYRQLTDQMNWVGNWMLWGSLHWSDMGVLLLDRTALGLNRVMALGLTVFFIMLAVRLFQRRDQDPGRLMQRFYPAALLGTGLRLLPYAAIALVAGIVLYAQVYRGAEGEMTKKAGKDYWRKNHATWRDAPLPALSAVDLDLDLEPAQSSFRVKGTFEILNLRETPLRQFPLTAGDHWENVAWTMNGKDYQPENRSLLYVFTPESELAPGKTVRVGFSFTGKYPKGISKNGKGTEEFILPSGVVLTSFRPSFIPVLGYIEEAGIDKENKHEEKEYPDDFYLQRKDPAFGSSRAFTTHLRISAPQEFTINSIGTLEREEVAGGRRTVEWRSDHPVRFFNVVAGKWAERRGNGTVVYYHPGHSYNIDEISEALDASRKYYSEWFYPYPWKVLKLSEFPNYATYAQGFSTNITFSEGIGFLTRSEPQSDAAFMVTAHEAAHQWWGNILTPGKGPNGNILAEGMAHFSTALLFEQVKGPRGRIEFLKQIESQYEKKRRKDSERPLVKIDGSQDGDTTVTYDKGGWVFWMLLRHMGREQTFKGLHAFIEKYHDGPDFPVLQNFLAAMRPFSPDPIAFDAFTRQWFYEVVVPEYKLSQATCEAVAGTPDNWEVTLQIANAGTGRMAVEVAAVAGERFGADGRQSETYREARVSVELGAGETKEVRIRCPFKPEMVLVDPDALVLQLGRKLAIVRF